METVVKCAIEEDAFFKEEKHVQDSLQDPLLILQNLLLAIAHAEEEQKRILQNGKADSREKTIEKKTEIEKKKKDITILIEDEESKEKLKDKLMDDILSITIDMDGFEKFHLKQYEQQLANYARFLSEYLEAGGRGIIKKTEYSYNSEQKEEQMQKSKNVEMINYAERLEYARASAMNGILGGGNHIDPLMKEQWELWRIFQHNQAMSFLYTAQWRNS